MRADVLTPVQVKLLELAAGGVEGQQELARCMHYHRHSIAYQQDRICLLLDAPSWTAAVAKWSAEAHGHAMYLRGYQDGHRAGSGGMNDLLRALRELGRTPPERADVVDLHQEAAA